MFKVGSIFLLVFRLAISQSCNYDKTLTAGAFGESVSTATYQKLINKLGFDDRGFFDRFSFVESNYGQDILEHYGNIQQIWPLDESNFQSTKNSNLSEIHSQLQNQFNIEWENVTYEELNIPFYSGISFYLYLEFINAFPIPWDDIGQAELYRNITNEPILTWECSVDILGNLQSDRCKNEEIDLAFLADESGSVAFDDFGLMMKFISDIIGDLTIGANATRTAVRTFSFSTLSHFTLSEYDRDLVNRTLAVNQRGGGTATATALSDVLEHDFQEASGMRKYSKKMLVILTDGRSNDKNSTLAQAQVVHENSKNIQVISIGVGPGPDLDELKAIATSQNQMFTLTDFEKFDDVKELITNTVCNAPIVGGESETIIYITVPPAEFVIQLGKTVPGSATVQLKMQNRTKVEIISSESVELFSSYTHKTPSAEVRDFRYSIISDTVFSVKNGTNTFYTSLFNHGTRPATVQIEVLSSNLTADEIEIPVPEKCGTDGECGEDGKCKFDKTDYTTVLLAIFGVCITLIIITWIIARRRKKNPDKESLDEEQNIDEESFLDEKLSDGSISSLGTEPSAEDNTSVYSVDSNVLAVLPRRPVTRSITRSSQNF